MYGIPSFMSTISFLCGTQIGQASMCSILLYFVIHNSFHLTSVDVFCAFDISVLISISEYLESVRFLPALSTKYPAQVDWKYSSNATLLSNTHFPRVSEVHIFSKTSFIFACENVPSIHLFMLFIVWATYSLLWVINDSTTATFTPPISPTTLAQAAILSSIGKFCISFMSASSFLSYGVAPSI